MLSSLFGNRPATSSRNQEYLNDRYFTYTIGAALLLHLIAFYIWYLSPKTQIVDIPVRVLNIKLTDTVADNTPLQPTIANNIAIENTLSQLVQPPQPEQKVAPEEAKPQPVQKTVTVKSPPVHFSPSHAEVRGKFDMREEGVATAAPVTSVVASQFVRSTNAPADIRADGSNLGNSGDKGATIASRYEQMISLWIQKFKIYPEEARRQGMQGETVVRIRIDREGNIVYSILDHSTGYPLLDQAAADMVQRANPVPAVPNGYPAGDTFEFLIPVSFRLK